MDQKEARNKYMKERRARLRSEGTCVDCQKRAAYVEKSGKRKGQRHVVCKWCLDARRERFKASVAQYPLPLPINVLGR